MPQALTYRIRLVWPPHGPTAGLADCGRIAAGMPLEAIEERQRGELLALLTAPGRYALQVADDSLCEAGILAGDIIVVQSQQSATSGDIVVGLLDDEQVVLKRIRFAKDRRIRLLADNAAEHEQVVDATRLAIQGRVIAQIRRYR